MQSPVFTDLHQLLSHFIGVSLNGLVDNYITEHRGPRTWEGIVDTQINNYITGDPAFAIDRRGVVVLWNAAAEKTLGHPTAEALGRKCWRLLSGKDHYGNRYCCRHCPLREMAFRHEPVNNFQSVFKAASGAYIPFNVSCLTIIETPDNEMLLHICRTENQPEQAGSLPPPARTHVNKLGTLSQRELEVLALLAEHTSTKDIASRMSISIRTVRTHIQHLMYKLQVHKRTEAVQVGNHLKLI